MKLSAIAKRLATQVLSLMRGGRSLSQASKSVKTTSRTVKKYAAQRLERSQGGRYGVRRGDQKTRSMRFLTPKGLIALEVHGSDSATRVAQYWNAVHKYLKTGDTTQLKRFRGERLQSRGQRFLFVTDTDLLERLAHAGEVQFEDIYKLST